MIDFIFVLIFIWAAFRGFNRGFIMQLTSLAGLILGIYFAVKFSHSIYQYYNKNGAQDDYLSVFVFAITFLVVVVALFFLGKLMEKLIEAVALGIVNRLLGMIFGLLKYALLISAVLVILNAVNRNVKFLPDNKIKVSHLYRPLSSLVPLLFPNIFKNIVPPVNIPEKPEEEKNV